MRTSKQIDYYYKSCDLESVDDQERKCFEKYNDYGYNFGSTKRRFINYEEHVKKIKHRINKNLFNNK